MEQAFDRGDLRPTTSPQAFSMPPSTLRRPGHTGPGANAESEDPRRSSSSWETVYSPSSLSPPDRPRYTAPGADASQHTRSSTTRREGRDPRRSEIRSHVPRASFAASVERVNLYRSMRLGAQVPDISAIPAVEGQRPEEYVQHPLFSLPQREQKPSNAEARPSVSSILELVAILSLANIWISAESRFSLPAAQRSYPAHQTTKRKTRQFDSLACAKTDTGLGSVCV